MVDVGGRPILWHIMKYYAQFDVRDFVIALGYRGSVIKDYFLNYEAMNSDFTVSLGRLSAINYHAQHEEQDYRVTLADTGVDSMTGARVARVERYVGNERFLITYGDGLTDLDLDAALRFHAAHGRLMTVTTVRPTSRFGMLDVTAEGRVDAFTEKPQLDGWASAGYFICEPEVFRYLDVAPGCILEQEPLQRLAAAGELMAYRHEGFFYAMDTYREYLHLNAIWESGDAPWSKVRRGLSLHVPPSRMIRSA